MPHRFSLPTSIALPALVLSLSACPGEDPVEAETSDSETESTESPESTSTDPPVPTTTLDPSTTGTDPTTTTLDPSTTSDPSTTGDPTSDPSTSSTTATTDTTTDPSGTTIDDSTTDGTTTDGTTTDGTTGGTTTDGTTGGTTTGDVFELASIWVTVNPAGLATDQLVGFDPALAKLATVTPVGDVASIQSIAVTGGGDGLVTVDLTDAGKGGVVIDEDMVNNPPAMGTIGVGQRFIRGPLTELLTPKGVEADVPGGVFLVADTAAKDIKAFDDDDDGEVAPVYKITNLGGSPAVWDMHYEDTSDTLYAAGTDGVVRVYDNFSTTKGAMGPTRSVTPFFNNAKASINLHGVAVVNNVLYLSDVGDANNATDGQVFVLNGADVLTGNVPVTQRLSGGQLGNPVDLEVVQQGMTGDVLVVAEKANDRLIFFNRPPMGMFGAPVEVMRTKLESVAVITNNRVILASNPTGVEADQAQVQAVALMNTPMPSSVLTQLGSATSVQSLTFNAAGDAHVSFDGPAQSGGGGVFNVPGLALVNQDGNVRIDMDRLWGPDTAIGAPKGVVLSDLGDALFVADFGAAAVKVYAATSGDEAPAFILNDLGAAPWDVAYDDAGDRLYVACVDGVVRVYDDVLATQGGTVARAITPTDDQNQKLSVNLHGIVYDAAGDLLLLSDVGSAMVNTDGQLFLVGGASTADGDVPVLAQVGGDQTKLGNPVDIAHDGVNLYVAEKANSQLLRYDNFTTLTGANNLAESAAVAVTNPESVALFLQLVP